MDMVCRSRVVPLFSLALLLFVPAAALLITGQGSAESLRSLETHFGAFTGPWDQTVWTRYRDLDDTENELKVLSASYPDICRLYNLSAMFPHPGGSPRYSVHNRTIWGLKISDEPDINDTSEPEVFYCALTHAREWISNEVLMYFINYILRNHACNTTISSIVNSTQLWFVPVVNPDGFQESIDRDDFNNSYGLYGWRKNTNETNGSPGFQNYGSAQGDGTDLNRNFGYKWGYPGSSTNPNYPTYRGSNAFSEPETQMIRELFKARDFKMAVSFHSFSGLNLYAWGYTTDPAPDVGLLSRIAQRMADINGYTPMPSSSLYATSGDFVDYVYGTYRIPAFTVEINHRNSRFIPELSKVPEDCHLNREVCFLMAELSSDPYSVFGSGINGTVVTIGGQPVPEASVNIVGMGRDIDLTTAANGGFRVSLEPGSYNLTLTKGDLFNRTTTFVSSDTYVDATYMMRDTTPPEVRSVMVLYGGERMSILEWRSNATIRVAESDNETGLSGTVELYDPDRTGPLFILDLHPNGAFYEAWWDTSYLEPQKLYGLETRLMDSSGNSDMNGSDPHTFDLMIWVNDTTPPALYNLEIKGEKNDKGSFELGHDFVLSVNVTGASSWETSVSVNLTVKGQSTSVLSYELEHLPATDMFQAKVPTRELMPGHYGITIGAKDSFQNSVTLTHDGFDLSDTTGPEFLMLIGNYQTGAYRSGTIMEFVIRPLAYEPYLNASVNISGPGLCLELSEAIEDARNGTLTLLWDSYNVPTGAYRAEGRLADIYGNSLPDGAKVGPDLDFDMVDLTPPEVLGLFIDGVEITEPTTVNATDRVSVMVRPRGMEEGLSCAIAWVVVGKSIGGSTNLTLVDGSFTGLLSWEIMGGYGSYHLEVMLSDRFGNTDPDGSFSDHDLMLVLKRPAPSFFSVRAYNLDYNEVWQHNVDEWVLEGEMIEISCVLGNLTDKDHMELCIGKQSLVVPHSSDIVNGTSKAVFVWNTSGRTGEHNITWMAVPDSSQVVIAPSYHAFVVPRYRDHVKGARVAGYHPDGKGGLILNLTWTGPEGARSLSVTTYINGRTSGSLELPPDANKVSLGIPWEDVRIVVSAVYDLFPEGADRSGTAGFYLLEEGVSMVTFKPPERPGQPVVDDDGDERPLPYLTIALVAASVLLLMMVLLVLFIGRRDRVLPVEVWEE